MKKLSEGNILPDCRRQYFADDPLPESNWLGAAGKSSASVFRITTLYVRLRLCSHGAFSSRFARLEYTLNCKTTCYQYFNNFALVREKEVSRVGDLGQGVKQADDIYIQPSGTTHVRSGVPI